MRFANIQRRTAARDGRMVTTGQFVVFSTENWRRLAPDPYRSLRCASRSRRRSRARRHQGGRGGKKFEALVAEGEKVKERIKVAADERLAKLREKATGAWDELEKVFEDRVARALHTLNVPSRHDIDTLSERVHELTVHTKKLSEEEETRGHGRAHRARAE
jgi:poly(hydroxyalkanoate) granule-associated protein